MKNWKIKEFLVPVEEYDYKYVSFYFGDYFEDKDYLFQEVKNFIDENTFWDFEMEKWVINEIDLQEHIKRNLKEMEQRKKLG